MKKHSGILSSILMMVVLTTSCMKENIHHKKDVTQQSQTLTIELQKNQSWQYELPVNISDDPYKIATQAEHYKVSEIKNDETYFYTPALNYTGVDKVVIMNLREQHHTDSHHNNNNGHGCGNNDEVMERIMTINFVIKEKEQGKFLTQDIPPVF